MAQTWQNSADFAQERMNSVAKKRTKEGKQFLKGEAKSRRLQELEAEAVSNALNANSHYRRALGFALEAGKALNEARRILGGGKYWGQWRKKHFCERTGLSERTARDYARIAREWDTPPMKAARARGLTQASLEAVLKILRGDSDTKRPKPSEHELLMEEARQDLRTEFAKKLRELDYEELQILSQGFEYYFWPNMNNDLRDTLCKVVEYDYYYEHHDSMEERRTKREDKKRVRTNVNNALNQKAKSRRKATDALNRKSD